MTGKRSRRNRSRRPQRKSLGRTIAVRYTCGHCPSVVRVTQVGQSTTAVDILHEPTCPVLLGQVSPTADICRALSGGRST
jgi:hypothetical protein